MSQAHAFQPVVTELGSAVFVGHQPIFDRDQALYGYELLFRDGGVNAATASSDEFATLPVLSTTFLDIGFDQIVGTARAFINCPRSLLVNDCHLPVDRAVLELVETLVIDEALIEGCRPQTAGVHSGLRGLCLQREVGTAHRARGYNQN